MNDLESVADSFTPVMNKIESLTNADSPFFTDNFLKADYFSVNAEQIDLPNDTDIDLVSPFCVAGMSVLKFELAATFESDAEDGPGPGSNDDAAAMLILQINGETVAATRFADGEDPSNVSLIYRDLLDVDSVVRVGIMVMSRIDDTIFIGEERLQWGYKIYGPEYALIEDVDTTCFAM